MKQRGVWWLLRHRPTRLLWASQLGSVTGDRLYMVALTWLTLRLTGSPAAVAGVSLAGTIPFLLAGLTSGWIADRGDGLAIARTVDGVRAAVVLVVPLLYMTGHLSVVVLATGAAALSALEAFFLPALQASLPRLVDSQALPAMVSALDSTDRLGRVLGPGLIGVLGFVPEIHFFTLDALTFAASAVCLTLILPSAAPIRQAARPPEKSRFAELAAGWRVTFANRDLRVALLLRGATNIAWPAFTIASPFVITQTFHHGVAGYGLLLAAFGLGNVPGSVLAARVPARALLLTCCAAWAGSGVGFIALAVAPNLPTFITIGACIGVCTPLANVTVNRRILDVVPNSMLARAYATQRLVVVGASVLGLPIVGALTTNHGPHTAIAAAGCLIFAASLVALTASSAKKRTVSHGLG